MITVVFDDKAVFLSTYSKLAANLLGIANLAFFVKLVPVWI